MFPDAPGIISARYERATRRMVLELDNNCSFTFPVDQVEGLAGQVDDVLEGFLVSPSRQELLWRELGVGHAVGPLMRGVFGGKAWMSEEARQARSEAARALGRLTSPAKAAAARANGAKGGRPKKARA